MTLDTFMHGLAIASLFIFAGAGVVAAGTITVSLRRNWTKITAAYRGEWFAGLDQRPPLRASNDFLPESTNARGAA